MVATNKGDRWFFVFGFAKNETGNINKTKEKALKKLAEQYLSYTTAAIEKIKKTGEIIELSCHEKNEINDT